MHELSTSRCGKCGFWLPLGAALLFMAAHTQSPHFYSNQNQYYLHGLALAGYGDLTHDWLANTTDPTPLFSGLIAVLYRSIGMAALWAVYAGIQVVYFLSLWHIGRALPFFPRSIAGQLALAAGVIVLHSAAIRIASVQLCGVDYPWYGQAGIANQYLLGAVLQPSVFGVLLLSSLAAYCAHRPTLAAFCVVGACGLHSTYLLPGALLVVGMMVGLSRERGIGIAGRTGAVALLGVMPIIGYVLVRFGPTDPETFAESQQILAWVRIPHHTRIVQWLDGIAWLQIGGMAGGILLFRRTRLFPVLIVATTGAVILTIIQFTTASATLALLFPWRLSVVLVPLAAVAFLAGGARGWERVLPAWGLSISSGIVALGTAIASVILVQQGYGYQESHAEAELLEAVAAYCQPGEQYLLPTRFPPLSQSRGSYSSTFMTKKSADTANIFELQRFRLATGAAVSVDFKSIPYRDRDVLEWQRRVAQAERWYATPDWDTSGVLSEILRAGITHVVVPNGVSVRSSQWELVLTVPAYRVYRILPTAVSLPTE
ncbi:MAG: hypothetical protein LC104_15460 [Bacteroidales bacterium]|nr:hypothetical protein [Bacteroidales bacterium]